MGSFGVLPSYLDEMSSRMCGADMAPPCLLMSLRVGDVSSVLVLYAWMLTSCMKLHAAYFGSGSFAHVSQTYMAKGRVWVKYERPCGIPVISSFPILFQPLLEIIKFLGRGFSPDL